MHMTQQGGSYLWALQTRPHRVWENIYEDIIVYITPADC